MTKYTPTLKIGLVEIITIKNMFTRIKNWLNSILSSIRYKYSFLKVLNSPFRGLKLTWYFGKIVHGTPYFLPRRIIKSKTKPGYNEFIPIKYFGYQFTSLGWKTKWTATDYRFEWNPCISIVLFGKQLFIGIVPNINEESMPDCYWEAWLMYEHDTDKTKSKLERLKELISKYSCTWTHSKGDEKVSVNHYKYILKEKYLKLVDIEATVEKEIEDI